MTEDVEPNQENLEGVEPEAETPAPEFVCGIQVFLNMDGTGVEFNPMQDSRFARVPSLSDLNMMTAHLHDHTVALMAAEQVVTYMERKRRAQEGLAKVAKGLGRGN